MKFFFTLVLPSSSSQIESGLILLGCPTSKRLQLASTGRLCILRGKCCHYMHSWRGRSKWGSYSGPKADASEVPGSQEVNVHPSVSVATIPLLARTTQNITFYIFHFLALFFRVLERRKRDGLVLTNHFFSLSSAIPNSKIHGLFPVRKEQPRSHGAFPFRRCCHGHGTLNPIFLFKKQYSVISLILPLTIKFSDSPLGWVRVRILASSFRIRQQNCSLPRRCF